MEYKLSKEVPAIYPRLKEKFGVKFKDIVIAYGDTIYCIDGNLPRHTIEHELVHLKQQAQIGVEKWWDKYINDNEFRLSQEIEAYKTQARYLRSHPFSMSLDHYNQWIYKLASDLSGPMYGNIISFNDALTLCKLV